MLKEKDTKSPPLFPQNTPHYLRQFLTANSTTSKTTKTTHISFLPSSSNINPLYNQEKKEKKPGKQTTTRGVYNNIKRKSRPRFLEWGAKLAERPTWRHYKRIRARDSHTQRGRAGGDDATQRNALKAQVPRVLFGLGTRRTLTTSGIDGKGRSDGKCGTHQFCPGPLFEENLRVPELTLSHLLPAGVWTSVGRVSVFKTQRFRVSGAFSDTWPSPPSPPVFLKKNCWTDPGRVSKNWQTKISAMFQSASSQTVHTSRFSNTILTQRVSNFLFFEK